MIRGWGAAFEGALAVVHGDVGDEPAAYVGRDRAEVELDEEAGAPAARAGDGDAVEAGAFLFGDVFGGEPLEVVGEVEDGGERIGTGEAGPVAAGADGADGADEVGEVGGDALAEEACRGGQKGVESGEPGVGVLLAVFEEIEGGDDFLQGGAGSEGGGGGGERRWRMSA